MEESSGKRKISNLIGHINDYQPHKKIKMDASINHPTESVSFNHKHDHNNLEQYQRKASLSLKDRSIKTFFSNYELKVQDQSQQISKPIEHNDDKKNESQQKVMKKISKSKQKKQQLIKIQKDNKSSQSKRKKQDKVKKQNSYDKNNIDSPFQRKTKAKQNKGRGQSEAHPIRISDPPSNHKNNVVVTRGVDFVPVDLYFEPRQNAKVFEFHKAFYSITLSQSNLAKDDNKFFIIQLIVIEKSQQQQEYYLFCRWGRVGVVGQMTKNKIEQRKEAIRQYNAKSQAKVNHGGYRIVEMSYEHDQGIQQIKQKELIQIDQYLTKENSSLPPKVQELMKLIFDMKMMQTHMRQIGYDEKRSPLGLIARSAIDKGYLALDSVMKVLKSQMTDQQKRNKLNQYSSQFYSAIPHDFGYMNMKAFVLNNEDKVKQKLQMLASLSQIQIYSDLMKEKPIDARLPDIDIKYSKLKCDIAPLSKEAPMYSILYRYLKNTHAKTHDKYTMELVEIFTLKRPNQSDRFMGSIGNKVLLWHGSRLTNYVGILSQGLKIAPYEAPSTGYMFGKGIYFADIASKSANYCLPKHNSSGLLLLCEVALGQMNDKFAADYTAHNLPAGKHSTRGVGKFAPSNMQVIDNVSIPNGELKPTGIQQTSLLYNEYVVYNRQQIQCKYIVQVNFIIKK